MWRRQLQQLDWDLWGNLRFLDLYELGLDDHLQFRSNDLDHLHLRRCDLDLRFDVGDDRHSNFLHERRVDVRYDLGRRLRPPGQRHRRGGKRLSGIWNVHQHRRL